MVVVGLVAESDLPMQVLEKIAGGLERELADRVDDRCAWQVKVSQEALPIDEEGNIPVVEHASTLQTRLECDQLIYVTDLPRLVAGAPLVAEISASARATLISAPAMGYALARRLHDTILQAVAEMTHDVVGTRPGRRGRVARDRLQPVGQLPRTEEAGASHIKLTGARGHVRLLIGMVRSNRPWRLVPALSGATAAAAATGAFGIFYNSIWSMADSLSPWRLTGISLLAIAIMTIWLVAYNGLWERPGGPSPRRKELVYNASTMVTVAMAVTIMYLVLFLLILLGALAVIASDFMQQQLQQPVNLLNYVSLAWLSTSMGTVAGALGSSWDSDKDVRQATYSQREYERRTQTSDWEE